jgi:ribA/ribD-fused uncharacterized protein
MWLCMHRTMERTMSESTDLPLSLAALVEKMAAGGRPEFLFFWGHRAKGNQEVGKHVFSQWWPAPFKTDGGRYPTAEHYMMAEKARLFGDLEMLERIRRTDDPAEAKKLGRKVRGFDAERWDAVAFERVVSGNLAKFGQNRPLKSYLLATGDKVLVEASPLDRIWGIGIAAGDPRAANPAEWQGKNLLGFALMAVRAELARAG